MSVVALEAVVEKGAIRLDALQTVPDQTKVFILIPDVEPSVPVGPPLAESDSASAEPESALALGKRLQEMARTLGPKKVKLSDYAGVGKELWSTIDVDAYIEEERNSWERSLRE